MIDGGEGFVKVMQPFAPFLIFRRAAKAHRMVFQRVPLDQDQILPAGFQAALERNRLEALHGADERHGIVERGLILAFHAGFDVADERFQNHFTFCRNSNLRPPSVNAAAIRALARSGMMKGIVPTDAAAIKSIPLVSANTGIPNK